MELVQYQEIQKKFELVCKSAENLTLVQSAGVAFEAVMVVKNLREILSDEIMKEVFMPLMNTKIGFKTDRTGKPNWKGEKGKPEYSIDIVRDCIIDAIAFGLTPTFNQFNIISDNMYATKEGFTLLLKKLDVKYILAYGLDISAKDAKFAQITVNIKYTVKGEEQKPFSTIATVPKNAYSSYDQLKGKAERRAKKVLYEYVTGLDLGESDNQETEDQGAARVVDDAKIIDQPEPAETKPTEKLTEI